MPDTGNAHAGQIAITRLQCGACHVIPGIRGARGRIGPPLNEYGKRVYIAGTFPRDFVLALHGRLGAFRESPWPRPATVDVIWKPGLPPCDLEEQEMRTTNARRHVEGVEKSL